MDVSPQTFLMSEWRGGCFWQFLQFPKSDSITVRSTSRRADQVCWGETSTQGAELLPLVFYFLFFSPLNNRMKHDKYLPEPVWKYASLSLYSNNCWISSPRDSRLSIPPWRVTIWNNYQHLPSNQTDRLYILYKLYMTYCITLSYHVIYNYTTVIIITFILCTFISSHIYLYII